MRATWIGLCILVLGMQPLAKGTDRVPVPFTYEWDVGLGYSVYLVGNHPDVGEWNPVLSQRLAWTPGNIWTGSLGLQAGTELEYKFIARQNSRVTHCDDANVEWMSGANLVTNVPAAPGLPYSGKTIYYHSNWTNAFILHRVDTNFVNVAMERVGEGRSPGESLYRVAGIGESGAWIEFVPNGFLGGEQQWDNAPYPGYGSNNFATELDQLFVQDKDIFNYRPPASVGGPRLVTTNIASTVSGLSGRRVRVWLPRGYDENEWKRYPVVYMHDGQNVFESGFDGVFPPDSWKADESSQREISQGRMREVILVAIDNGPNRFTEYCPPGDSVNGHGGIGNLYAEYIETNVRPWINSTFRVLTNRANTAIVGSSLGGLISAYIGLEASEAYGAIGAMSPSFWTADHFVQRVGAMAKQPVRIYIDGGTGEGDSIWALWSVHDHLLRSDYVQYMDTWTVIECGAGHNEPAWERRFPDALRFLLPLHEEANALIHESIPLQISASATSGATVSIDFPAFRGWSYLIERTGSMIDPVWNPVQTNRQAQAWGAASVALPIDGASAIYRIRAVTAGP